MPHCNQRSLIFYGVAIGSVVILFRLVTWYGTTHLRAPASIYGDYGLTLSPSPPCLQADSLVLTIQQSGTYLNGRLEGLDPDRSTKRQEDLTFPLKGQWRPPVVTLQGQLSGVDICGQDPPGIEISGIFTGDVLVGQIRSPGLAGQFSFQARLLGSGLTARPAPSH